MAKILDKISKHLEVAPFPHAYALAFLAPSIFLGYKSVENLSQGQYFPAAGNGFLIL